MLWHCLHNRNYQICFIGREKQMNEFKVTPIFPYPYCCLCFEELNDNNIVIRKDVKWDVCLDCEDKTSWDHENE
jgi:hypothetical protein